MTELLDRDDIIAGLREVARRARRAGIRGASIHIVGGAALRLAYFERASTADVDARIQPFDSLEPIAMELARENNWPSDWLNDNATQFIPAWGRQFGLPASPTAPAKPDLGS